MRILHVHPINQVAQNYMRGLAELGHTGTLYEPSLVGGGAVLPLKLAMMPGRLFDLRHVVGDLDPQQYDLAHIHWASYGILGLAGRIPYVVQCHGTDVRTPENARHSDLLSPVLRRAAAVLCITPDLMPVVRMCAPDALFLPGRWMCAQFSPPQMELPPHPWTILLFTRLEPIKGVEVAIEGIVRFVARHPEVQRASDQSWKPEQQLPSSLWGPV